MTFDSTPAVHKRNVVVVPRAEHGPHDLRGAGSIALQPDDNFLVFGLNRIRTCECGCSEHSVETVRTFLRHECPPYPSMRPLFSRTFTRRTLASCVNSA